LKVIKGGERNQNRRPTKKAAGKRMAGHADEKEKKKKN